MDGYDTVIVGGGQARLAPTRDLQRAGRRQRSRRGVLAVA